ncbi:hypothetical protein [Crateriforma spongiae]|uniref:hypothetical protein n=1 Tax=Crateriforma spongiae TaxID=2724528 RepID=UPI00144771AF|nr:hypothetical protein [Crateriforma spongiae]
MKAKLPVDASRLVALARVAHLNGDKKLERSCNRRLAERFGIRIVFICRDATERELRRTEDRRDG